MEERIKKTLKSLGARNLKPHFAENCNEARRLMLNLISRVFHWISFWNSEEGTFPLTHGFGFRI
jgi:hypothetical protein